MPNMSPAVPKIKPSKGRTPRMLNMRLAVAVLVSLSFVMRVYSF